MTLALPPVAIMGVGNMGGGMARNLLAKGVVVHVCDIDADKTQALLALGARVAACPAQLAGVAALYIVCVVTASQVNDVLWGEQGLAAQLQPGNTVMLCPTIAPEDTEAVAARLAEHAVATLDAPMSGGPQRAALGTMSLMVAGADAVIERHQALLNALANPVFRISQRVGDGARTKLVNNLLAGINLVGAAEALALAERMGLDGGRTLQVMAASSAQSWIASDRMPRALAGDWTPRAHMTLLEKDTGLAQQMALKAGYVGPLGPGAAAVFAQASAAGLAELDDAAVLRHLRAQV
ncbi:MAG: 2-(hydroxymethyl)glutarate dehydrogenase [Pseudomonadota bacterium]|jgi:3-hydroxyisobutyrate dehydrogenase-like beta-hydroxyacid dehydrogenase